MAFPMELCRAARGKGREGGRGDVNENVPARLDLTDPPPPAGKGASGCPGGAGTPRHPDTTPWRDRAYGKKCLGTWNKELSAPKAADAR